MRIVFEHITRKSATFNERPLFVHLRDERVEPHERLRFVPHVAHFVMTFADFYHFFLVEESPRDRYEELMNAHLAEEGSHWKWFLSDLASLDLDPTMRFTDALRFVWSDSGVKTRKLAYAMCKLSGRLTSLEKLVMVLAIEATGRVALEAAVHAGRSVQTRSGRSLVYFGDHHLETERMHTVEDTSVRGALEAVALSEAVRIQLKSVVDSVFAEFTGFIDEAYDAVTNGRAFHSLSAPPDAALHGT